MLRYRSALLAEEFVEGVVERNIFTLDYLQNLSIRSDDKLGGEALNTIHVRNVCRLITLTYVQPWNLMSFDSVLPFILSIVAVNTQDLELVLVLAVVRCHLGESLDAVDTP